MSVRVYVPLARAELVSLVGERALPGPLPAHAVTDGLRAAWADGDDEEWEYAALAGAAAESWQLRAGDDPPRRLVVAADVAAVGERDGEPTAVLVVDGLRWQQVAAAHVDTTDQAADDDGEVDADLAWFATQEIPHLLD